MFKLFIIHLIALLLVSISFNAKASTIEVDFPSSNAKEHTLRITVNNCTTLFKIKTEDLLKINNDETLSKFTSKALERSKTGCKDNLF